MNLFIPVVYVGLFLVNFNRFVFLQLCVLISGETVLAICRKITLHLKFRTAPKKYVACL